MAFTDALFDGTARLDGVLAKRIKTLDNLPFMLRCRGAISVATEDIGKIVSTIQPDVVVDARMRKHSIPEPQRELARLTIGLGPNFIAGENVDMAVETSWGTELGRVIRSGATKGLHGEPSELGTLRRERFVYSPAAGTFSTQFAIGQFIEAGDSIGTVSETLVRAPVTGRLRGLSHDRALVEVGTKIVEIDPREDGEILRGVAERPRRIAEGVLEAVCAALATGDIQTEPRPNCRLEQED
jgi:xanthine dehydrogenase accessory factor